MTAKFHMRLPGPRLNVLGPKTGILNRFRPGRTHVSNTPPTASCSPGGLTDFVDLVVPELQARGVFRTAYAGGTLRELMGFDRPPSRHALKARKGDDCAA
jgi:hypothetical protein